MVRVKLHSGNEVVPAATGIKPESIPSAGVVMIVHGEAKVDCVTVWFFDWLPKVKSKLNIMYWVGSNGLCSQLERNSITNSCSDTAVI